MFDGLREMFRRVKPVKIQGYIALYELEDFWMNKCEESEREAVRHHIEQLGAKSPVSLTDLEFRRMLYAVVSKVTVLTLFADVFGEEEKGRWCREQALLEAEKSYSPEKLHFYYMEEWKRLKKESKEDERKISDYISILEKDCRLHRQLKNLSSFEGVKYPAFKELALIYERIGYTEKAIHVSRLAIEESVIEETCFERRLKRLEKKQGVLSSENNIDNSQ